MYSKLFNTLCKINEPMNKETFFKISITLLIIQIAFVFLYTFVHFSLKNPYHIVILFFVFLVLIAIPILYMYFILSTKRIWDITGSKLKSLAINIPLFVASIIVFPLLIVVYVCLLLIEGKAQ